MFGFLQTFSSHASFVGIFISLLAVTMIIIAVLALSWVRIINAERRRNIARMRARDPPKDEFVIVRMAGHTRRIQYQPPALCVHPP